MTKEEREIFMDITASLCAAVSLLERGSKKAAPSNKMFDMMIKDYKKSLEKGRVFLKKSKAFEYARIALEAAETIEKLRKDSSGPFFWKEMDCAPWSEWVLVYRPLAPAQRMFGTDIRYPDMYGAVWAHSRPDEMPSLWCCPNIRRNDPK